MDLWFDPVSGSSYNRARVVMSQKLGNHGMNFLILPSWVTE